MGVHDDAGVRRFMQVCDGGHEQCVLVLLEADAVVGARLPDGVNPSIYCATRRLPTASGVISERK